MQQTIQCSRCGAQNYVGQLACWNCGQQIQYNCPNCRALVNPTYANCPYCQFQLPWQSNRLPQHDVIENNYQQPQYKMNSFQRHINWTWVIVALSMELLRWVFTFGSNTFPFYAWILFIIIYLVSEIAITVWALRRKSRSWLWVFFPIAVLFLKNNRDLNTTV